MTELEKVNESLDEVLIQLESIPAENVESDELVSNLLSLVSRRQIIVDQVISDTKVQPKYLQEQLNMSQSLSARAQKILQDRQDLLLLGKSNARKMNIYKNIESNR